MAKKVFIINFSTHILRDVALRMQSVGIHIIYWQGYRDYFKSIAQDKNNFPNTIFHYANDAMRNIPPAAVDTSVFKPLGKEILAKMSPYDWQALMLISRADYTNVPLTQKRNIYYQYIQFWRGMIEQFHPDVILFPDVPHSGNQYVLYALAKLMGVRVIIMEQISVETRTLLVNDYEVSSLALRDFYQAHKENRYRPEDLSADLKEYYHQQLRVGTDATPQYQKRASRRKAPFRTPTVRVIIRHILHFTLFKVTFSYLRMLWVKNEEQTLTSPMRGLQYKLIANKRNRLNKLLTKTYESLQQDPDWSKHFVYMPLSFQPERTSCPQAGVFDDQLLTVETVARSLPKGWLVYVKENPNQLKPANFFSHLYRYRGYYEYLAGLPNVQFVPVETSTYDLIQYARAVAIGTGTAGWEALLRGKPALVFGSVWYMYCDGALRVHNVTSCQAAINKIIEGFKPDARQVLNYLAALDRNSVRARHFRTLHYHVSEYAKDDYIAHEDNVRNLSEALIKEILSI